MILFSLEGVTFIFKSSNKNGVEETISDESEAFNASVLSPIVVPLPRKDAASPVKPLLLFILPISGERVTWTVYFLGMLRATTIPTIRPIPAALYNVLRILIISRKIFAQSTSIPSFIDLFDTESSLLFCRCSVMLNKPIIF